MNFRSLYLKSYPRNFVREKLKEVHFFTDDDKTVRKLRQNNTKGEKVIILRRPHNGLQK